MKPWLRVVGVLFGSLTAAAAEVVILRPIADTTLFETYPSNNLGRVQSLAAGTTAHARRSRALLRFDVAGAISSNATVLSAALTLTVVRTPSGGGVDSTFRLHRMVRAWTEGDKSTPANGSLATAGEATWTARAHPAPVWSAPGAAAPADFVEEASATQFVSGLGSYEFSELTDDVRLWQSAPAANFGWILISDDEVTQATARRFGAREDTNNAAQLWIQYTVPAPPRPRITQVERLTNTIRFQFEAAPNVLYSVERRGHVHAGMWGVLTNVPAAPSPRQISIIDVRDSNIRFYRVGAR